MVEFTSNLVSEAAKSGTVEHIVKLSVLDAEDEPGIMISGIHRQAEKKIEDSGIPFTFLRASGFMQNFVNFFNSSIKSMVAEYYLLSHRVNPYDADDDKVRDKLFVDRIETIISVKGKKYVSSFQTAGPRPG